MRQNWKLTVRYDGTRYFGWQRQPGRETIQGKLEGVLSRLCAREVEVIGAGRTDAGVHAEAMCANAVLETELTPLELCNYLNRYLPDDIAVVSAEPADARFHARYGAQGKTYRYTCHTGAVKPVFNRRYVTVLGAVPDLERMRRAAWILVGRHDFHNFCVNPRMKKSTVRTVDRIDIEQNGDYLTFTVHGDGFLQNMVRIMVGALLEIGFGRMEEEALRAVLASGERIKAGPTAPPQGLCLVRVDYE